MASYRQLCAKAKELGYELTPELRADLQKLSDVSDYEFKKKLRRAKIDALAERFQVTSAMMEIRLEGHDI